MERENPKFSFVSPVQQGENSLNKLVFEIQKVVQKIEEPFEIILMETQYIEEALKKAIFMTTNWYRYSGNKIQVVSFKKTGNHNITR